MPQVTQIALVVTVAALAGCAAVPHEAPALSAELGGRIKESRTAHEEVVRLYMNEKRAAVDRFVVSEWIPVFARNVFDRDPVRREWNAIVQSNDPVARLDFIKTLGPVLQAQINDKRSELIAPLDALERAVLRSLDEHYDEMQAMNATLTGLLASGAKASDTQQTILRGLGAESRLPDALQKADEVTALLTKGMRSYDENKGRIEEIVNQVKRSTGS